MDREIIHIYIGQGQSGANTLADEGMRNKKIDKKVLGKYNMV